VLAPFKGGATTVQVLIVATESLVPSPLGRAWELAAARQSDIDVVVILADERLSQGSVVDAVVDRLAADPAADAAIAVVAVARATARASDVVTVAADHDGTVRYLSRSVVPSGADPVRRTIGVDAYRWDALRRVATAGPTPLEAGEGIELLRAVEVGLRVVVVDVEPEPGTDTPAPVKLVVLDVDGVLTDGRISYLGDGTQLVSFDAKDGEGIKALERAGVEVATVTARDSPALRHRAAELGIAHLRTLVVDKAAEVTALATLLDIPLGQVCYMGDDVGDMAAMAICGRSAAPSDAMPVARRQATITLGRPGGRGAVRELSDLLLGGDHLLLGGDCLLVDGA
jgi:3-deoxy-D-manno-octulosonate 8-phosphate phosphatase (KDO 8-P phosphatase)